MRNLRPDQIAELERIMRAAGPDGLVKAEDVVRAAPPPDSPLHDAFVWDPDKAAHLYRIRQAQDIIQAYVILIPSPRGDVEVRAFVSLGSDRLNPGGGYRPIGAVLSNAEWRAEFLRTALAELDAFRRRYATLEELAADVDRVARRHRPKAGHKRPAAAPTP
jgi:hypothetical protein